MNNNRPSADDYTITDSHSSFDNAAVTNTDFCPYVNSFSNLGAASPLQSFWIFRRFQCRDDDAGAYLSVLANSNPGRIEELAAGSDDDIVIDSNVLAIITMKRCGKVKANTNTKMTANRAFFVPRPNPPSFDDLLEVGLRSSQHSVTSTASDVEAVY